jgi:hypothetical protein
VVSGMLEFFGLRFKKIRVLRIMVLGFIGIKVFRFLGSPGFQGNKVSRNQGI